MACLGKRVAGFLGQEVGVAHHLMEVVQPASGALHPLERFAEFADGRDGGVINAVRSAPKS
jgi:hypothetical protein